MQIDLITTDRKGYTFEAFVSNKIRAVLDEMGMAGQNVAMSDSCFATYMMQLAQDPPDMLIPFADQFKREAMEIPHLFIERESLAEVVHLLKDDQVHIAFGDRQIAKENILFFPMPADLDQGDNSTYDVVFFGGLVAQEALEATWQYLCPEGVFELLCEGVARCQQNPTESPLYQLTPHSQLSLHDQLMAVETFLKVRRTRDLVESFQDIDIHVFGYHMGKNWYRTLSNPDRVHLHIELPYREYFEVLKTSKMVVLDFLESYDGAGEWFFPALASGCLPFCSPTPYLQELLGNNSPLFYPYQRWDVLQDRVAMFLYDEPKRKALVSELQETLLPRFSWREGMVNVIEQTRGAHATH